VSEIDISVSDHRNSGWEVWLKIKGTSYLLLLSFMLMMSGCATFEGIIHVQPDGSGTITQSLQINRQMLEQMLQQITAMASSLGAKQNTPPAVSTLLDRMFQAREKAGSDYPE
jgi:hypothetical protein